MATIFSSSKVATNLAILYTFFLSSSSAQLSTDFYSESCPNLYTTVQSVVHSAIQNDALNGASLLRLFAMDCFVNGCDGSILLDDTPSFTGEKNAVPIKNALRGFDIVDNIKSAVENECPGIVSCADILVIAARDSVATLGGPYWDVKLGRRDATTTSQDAANKGIPLPTDNLDALVKRFNELGLCDKDMVALSGAHTIGQARCVSFRDRIYNETNIDPSLAQTRQANCPRASGVGDQNLAPIDLQTPMKVDNKYYENLVNRRGLLHSDQQLFSGGSTDSIVWAYINDSSRWESDFAAAMIKMGDVTPLTGSDGEIRRNCRRVN